MSRMIFVNLPVADVARSTAFYEAIGMVKNEKFSNDHGAAFVWSDTINFMLTDKQFYSTLTTRPIADTHATSAVLIALSHESRAEVDMMTDAAIAAGGREAHGPEDLGFMYSRAFWDPDGHAFGPMWMDVSAMHAATAHQGSP